MAQGYLEAKKMGSDFRMSDVIRVQTGVQNVETSSIEEKIEGKVLEKLKDVQESAYQEAYQLGLDEGKHEAYQKASAEIKLRLDKFEGLLKSIENLKSELIQQNETHLVELAFHMASRLAHAEIKADPGLITKVIRDAIEMSQIEEEVVVQVAPTQLEFLENLKKETGREIEFLKRVKLEAVAEISEGGCIIETNYGEIDARFEERVSKLWSSVSESLYRVKDKVSAA